jgi:hypothetical protein
MPEIDVDYIAQIIQNVLDKEFTEPKRKNLKYYPSKSHCDRINFCCPVCGDSHNKPGNKRGNFFFKNYMFKCFNCDESMSFLKFCKHFNQEINIEDKIKIYEYLDTHIKYAKNDDYAISTLDKLINIEDFIKAFNEKPNSWLVDIKPIVYNSKAYNYLKERLITNNNSIYQGIYRVVKEGKVTYKTNVLVFLNKSEDKLLGIQLRNLEKDRDKRFYKIVEFEELYNYINPNKPLDDLEAIAYNKLSHFYNILNVNFDKEVTIFEGYLDSLFFPNSIGMVGANNSDDILKFLLDADEDLKIRFFFDNDKKGREKAMKMISKGHQIFLWEKLFKELLKNKKNIYEAKRKLEKIIDLNNLVVESKNPNIVEKLKLNEYFSQDEFDKIFLDKNFI